LVLVEADAAAGCLGDLGGAALLLPKGPFALAPVVLLCDTSLVLIAAV
jgi:hypothetical protein